MLRMRVLLSRCRIDEVRRETADAEQRAAQLEAELQEKVISLSRHSIKVQQA